MLGATLRSHARSVFWKGSSSAPLASSQRFFGTDSQMKVACVQMNVTADKTDNLSRASENVTHAASEASLVMLPECFNSPYSTACFPEYAETISDGSPSVDALREMAASNKIYLVGGSIPEKEIDAEGTTKYYNTCLVFDPSGEIIAKHRKVHLFDIDIPGGIRFQESDILSPGLQATTFEIAHNGQSVKCGVGICFDMRFPEYALKLDDPDILVYPGAFNTTTGPLHWELLQRARAVDSQAYVVTCSPARSPDKDAYQAWGHSTVIDPWGAVQATCDEQETILHTELDLSTVAAMRQQIPLAPWRK